jgi:N-formylglutamate deformylase
LPGLFLCWLADGYWQPLGQEGRLNEGAQSLPDTDWFVDRLYDWAPELGAGMLIARRSRYVVDLNRSPDDAALYSTPVPGLVPLQTFAGEPLYESAPPGRFEIRRRLEAFWQPYHDALAAELTRIRHLFGYVILLDAHSIRTTVPRLFEGRLPDLNLGSFDGRSASCGLIQAVAALLAAQGKYSHVVDGRFKGGYITRHYGQPELGIHALQLEMAQAIYMQESPPRYDAVKAAPVVALLRELLSRLLEWGDDHG